MASFTSPRYLSISNLVTVNILSLLTMYDGVLQKFYHNHNSMMAFCQYAIISIVVVLLCSFTSYPTFGFLYNYLQ